MHSSDQICGLANSYGAVHISQHTARKKTNVASVKYSISNMRYNSLILTAIYSWKNSVWSVQFPKGHYVRNLGITELNITYTIG